MKTLQERFEEKITKTDNGCWMWIGTKNKAGYGKINYGGKANLAHRVAYKLYVGEIPEGLYVCHKCDTPGCVNPSHLFTGTALDNSHDCRDKGRHYQTKCHKEYIPVRRDVYMASRANQDLRKYAYEAGLFLWQLAIAYNVSYVTFSKHLSKEFTDKEKAEFKAIVDKIAGEK